MTSTSEASKADLISEAQQLADPPTDIGSAHQPTPLHRFITKLYEHVPPRDVSARSPESLAGAAGALWRFAGSRGSGEAKLRVYNPDSDADGWESPSTIVEIVNDDMPFLVDSITAAINQSGREVRLVIHPILDVERDIGGIVAALADPGEGWRESWMQIEVTREPDAAARERLAADIAVVLADTRSAVMDWPAMRRTLQEIAGNIVRRPPLLPPAEIAESLDFLRWLDDDNFTYLGFREYAFPAAAEAEGELAGRAPLGILTDSTHKAFGGLRDLDDLPPDVRQFVRRRELLIIAKTDKRATVHRAAHMDAIGIRRFDAAGEVVAVRLFVGLFTSLAYSRSTHAIPLLRQKVRRTIERAGLAPDSHDGKALLHILETFPRDDLFQISEHELIDTATGILDLQERQRIALFVRRDRLDRYVSCLVYVPRDRYDTALRQRIAAILEHAFAGAVSEFRTHFDDSMLARVQFVIRVTHGTVPQVDMTALERQVSEAGQTWSDRVTVAAEATFGEGAGRERLHRLRPFPAGYQERTLPAQALADLDRIDAVLEGAPLVASLHPCGDSDVPGLRLYRPGEPVILSDTLPILENLGLRIIAEEPFRIDTTDGRTVWVHEFTIGDGAVPAPLSPATRICFEEALVAVWAGAIENDGFNRLVLAAGLSARQTTILRLYCKVQRQAGSTFSQNYMEDTLARHPAIARRLVQLFEIRFDLAGAEATSQATLAEIQAIDHMLDAVESLDEDRILRAYLTLILKSVRTNYYQTLPSGEPKPALAVKLASHDIDLLPLPRPLYEIYVYSPRTEGVHMRAGKVARGGIRWSDRKEDFRTEILGLMKAQTVKNAVIVPVGSKGGFVLKQPPIPGSPAYRETFAAEGIECYKILIRGLLDVTDNIATPENGESGEGAHAIIPPPSVIRYDADDPYLVVAADKGTATFSDTANEISQVYGFWLGDAFASGGSAGYDHKEMGITSRGAWELVKRHFRELGRDIQTSDFTVVGVGDMSGDVFGNGMLRSRHTRLLAAFNHLHIFVDPTPDAAHAYIERERLFHRPRSSWADYDPALISPGGGVFERSAKAIAISTEMKSVFGITQDHLTPAELVQVLLTAEIDLLFFGGIGTFIKAQSESHLDVGDRANDALRINGEAVRAKVVGEGANLGVTQRGRVAYALTGGRIDTDAIDNSAGVSMSDHEVNIKILLSGAIAAGALRHEDREPLLAQMTDDVAALVLRDNYLQGEALSVAEASGTASLDRQARLIRDLERAGRLDRALEFLPDDKALAARAAARRGLTRPELAVLLAYAKMSLDEELLASDLPNMPEYAGDLCDYFPAALRERFAAQISSHPLRREIIATVVTNDLINRAGLTFVHDMHAATGHESPEITRAYRIVREAFDLPGLWQQIEALDNQVPAASQTTMLREIAALIEHATAWLLRGNRLDSGTEIARFAPAVRHLAAAFPELLPASDRLVADRNSAQLTQSGVPAPLAQRIGQLVFLAAALEIADLAERSGEPLDRAAQTYYEAGARFALDEMRTAAYRLPTDTPWQKQAVETVIDDLFALQSDLAARALKPGKAANSGDDPIGAVAAWAAEQAAALAPAEAMAAELRGTAAPDLAMLVVASRQLRQVLGREERRLAD
ncbi:MAG TPA: NAD-glutamate dehydrogenase [Stellaceae bacterium]|nr:NAD-glutamate dehydrogenase [Stellaceae bacterium]